MTDLPRISTVALVYKYVREAAERQGLVPLDATTLLDKHEDVEHTALAEGSLVLAFADAPDRQRTNLPRKFADMPKGGIKSLFLIFHRRADDLEKLDGFENTIVRLIKRHNVAGTTGIFLTVILPREHVGSSYIARRIDELPNKLPLPTRITLVSDYYFNSNRLAHVSVGDVRIVPEQEVMDILNAMSAQKSNLGNVYRHDVIAQWLGAEVGDVIEYITPCEVGFDVSYLVVK